MAGGVLGFFFGAKPKVPAYTPVSATGEQQATVQGNLGVLPGAQQLASGVNQFNMQELSKALEFAMPGGMAKVQSNLSSQLAGQINHDVAAAIGSSSVAKGFGLGIGGGAGIGRNLVARDLGLTSMGIQQQGFQNLMNWSQATKAPQMDVTSMFLSPAARLEFAQKQAEDQWNQQWLSSQISAAPHPAGAYSMELLMSAVKAFAGMAGAAKGCWVAREIYGESNPLWRMFQEWLLRDSPKWIKSVYLTFGPMAARIVAAFPFLKLTIKPWMDGVIWRKYGAKH